MLIFIYEYVSGGGTFGEPSGAAPEGSLLREGLAMLAAVAADIQAIDGVEVVVMRDRRTPAGRAT